MPEIAILLRSQAISDENLPAQTAECRLERSRSRYFPAKLPEEGSLTRDPDSEDAAGFEMVDASLDDIRQVTYMLKDCDRDDSVIFDRGGDFRDV